MELKSGDGRFYRKYGEIWQYIGNLLKRREGRNAVQRAARWIKSEPHKGYSIVVVYPIQRAIMWKPDKTLSERCLLQRQAVV